MKRLGSWFSALGCCTKHLGPWDSHKLIWFDMTPWCFFRSMSLCLDVLFNQFWEWFRFWSGARNHWIPLLGISAVSQNAWLPTAGMNCQSFFQSLLLYSHQVPTSLAKSHQVLLLLDIWPFFLKTAFRNQMRQGEDNEISKRAWTCLAIAVA